MLRGNHTTYPLKQAAGLRSIYSWLLLEMLMQFKGTGWREIDVDFFVQAEDGRRGDLVTGVQTCALPICTCAHLIQSAAGVMIFAEPRFATAIMERSEERRVGKECRSRWSQYHSKKN